MAKPMPGERELALFALAMVRQWGGVLEHPSRSELWGECNLPLGDEVDEFGGFSLRVNQSWWGHKAEKPSLLYVCRVTPAHVPPVTLQLAAPRYVVGSSGRRKDGSRSPLWRPDISKKAREATPPAFAAWLLAIARSASTAAVPAAASVGAQGATQRPADGSAVVELAPRAAAPHATPSP